MAFPPAAVRIEREVGTGDEAIDQIVSHMSRLARRDAEAQQITALARTLNGTDEFDTIRRIFFFIADLFHYKADPPGYEYLRAPIHSLLLREGDCDCMTTALAALLMAAGFEVAFVVIAWDKKRCTAFGCPYTHVYLLVHTSRYGWIPLDPVMQRDGLGREKAPIIRRKRYIVKLVTLEDDLKNSTGGTCRKRKVPVRLNIVNNIVAGNGNGNSQVHVRNNSPDAHSTSEQRHHGYYSDNSERPGVPEQLPASARTTATASKATPIGSTGTHTTCTTGSTTARETSPCTATSSTAGIGKTHRTTSYSPPPPAGVHVRAYVLPCTPTYTNSPEASSYGRASDTANVVYTGR